jgi:hypothetical protein
MSTMRRIVLVLMIALLPLRMWAAEDMAARMAVQPPAAAAAMDAAMPADCPMLHAQADDGSPSQQAGHCMACQLCAATAAPSTPVVSRGPAPGAPPPILAARFTSADVRHMHKPPIS